VLQQDPRLLRADWDVPLLYSALIEPQFPDVELLELLLSLGCSPNERFKEKSVWQHFLLISTQALRATNLYHKEYMIAVTELLLRYGAPRLLERRVVIPNQRPGTTRVRFAYIDTLAVTYFRAAFGDEEADRLDILAKWLEVSGQKAWVNSTRYLKSWLPGR
jgi:hypothetical protein